MSGIDPAEPGMRRWSAAMELIEAWLGEAMSVEPQAVHFAEVVYMITDALARPWGRGNTAMVLQRVSDYLALSRREWASGAVDKDLVAKLLEDDHEAI